LIVFDAWWNALNLELRLFYGIGIIALLFLMVQVFFSLFAGMDDMGDVHDTSGHSSGLSIFSIRGITAFFLGFGWAGVIALKAGWSVPAAIAVGIGAGAVMMFAIFLVMTSMLRLQSNGTLNYSNAVGQIATVYVTVPAGGKAGGQIELLLQGRLTMADALYRGSEPLRPGSKVRIVEKLSHATH
jgi:hypothetical protein